MICRAHTIAVSSPVDEGDQGAVHVVHAHVHAHGPQGRSEEGAEALEELLPVSEFISSYMVS